MTAMPDDSKKMIQRLFESEKMSPVLKASYQDELDHMLEPQLTARKALPGFALLGILVVGIAAIVRNLLVFEAKPLVIVSWVVLGIASAWAVYLILRDLFRRRHSPTSAFSISQAFFCAGGAMTVAALLAGMSDPSNPASTFNAMFGFVFFFTCAEWVTNNRIAAAELAAREQMLRIEYRLADLAERLAK
jgi:hypothetical protein